MVALLFDAVDDEDDDDTEYAKIPTRPVLVLRDGDDRRREDNIIVVLLCFVPVCDMVPLSEYIVHRYCCFGEGLIDVNVDPKTSLTTTLLPFQQNDRNDGEDYKKRFSFSVSFP